MWPLVAAAGTALATKLIDRGTDRVVEKIEGVPTPQDNSMGTESGQRYGQFLDAAFPGTTPWERLGANTPAGTVTAADIGSKTQERLQSKELANRSEIARGNNRASVIAAATPMGAQAVQAALAANEGGQAADYDNHVRQGRDRLPSQVREAESGAKLREAETGLHAERSKQAEDLVEAEKYASYGKIARDVSSAVFGQLRGMGRFLPGVPVPRTRKYVLRTGPIRSKERV